MYIMDIAKSMDSNKLLLIYFTLIYQLDLALQLNLVADNIILIFSQPNVNIIGTEIYPINSLYISNKTK